jgi:hypothetical protein
MGQGWWATTAAWSPSSRTPWCQCADRYFVEYTWI